MLKSPKKRFLESQSASVIADLSNNPHVVAAFDAAILQLAYEEGVAHDPSVASAIHYKLVGAHKLRDLFLTIAIEGKPPAKPRSDNLPHQV